MAGMSEERVSRVTMAVVRIAVGLLWLGNAGWKLPPDFGEARERGLFRFTRYAVDHPVFAPFTTVIREVVLPNFGLFGWLTLLVEATLGALLLLGWKTRWVALASVLQAIAITLAVARAPDEWPWSYFLMILVGLALFAGDAGRAWGLDGVLARGTDAALRGALGVIGAVGVVVGVYGVLAALGHGRSGIVLGYPELELQLPRVNVAGALLLLAVGVLAAVAAGTGRWPLAAIGAALAAALVVVTLVTWRAGQRGLIGADGRTLSFQLFLAVGLGLLYRARGRLPASRRRGPAG